MINTHTRLRRAFIHAHVQPLLSSSTTTTTRTLQFSTYTSSDMKKKNERENERHHYVHRFPLSPSFPLVFCRRHGLTSGNDEYGWEISRYAHHHHRIEEKT